MKKNIEYHLNNWGLKVPIARIVNIIAYDPKVYIVIIVV